jgi:hypothetical protein
MGIFNSTQCEWIEADNMMLKNWNSE